MSKYKNTIEQLDISDELKETIKEEVDGIEGKVLFISNEINQILEKIFIQTYTNEYMQKVFDLRNTITIYKFNASNLYNALDSIKKQSYFKYNEQLKTLTPVWGERSNLIEVKLRHFDLIIQYFKDYIKYINEQLNLLDSITYKIKT